jgi:hypothetical protein
LSLGHTGLLAGKSKSLRSLRRPGARPLAGAGISAVVAGALLSGCGTAPYAATVNGEAISVQELAAHARDWASSPAFVKYQDSQFLAQEAQAQAQGQTNVPNNTVEGNGTGPNVYGMYWTTLQLSNMITAVAVRQYLAARSDLPSTTQVAAAWSAEWADNPTIWSEVGQAARTDGATYDAYRAQLLPLSGAKADAQFYAAHRAYFWTSVCLLEDDVAVSGRGGTVDMAASRTQAEQVAAQLTANPSAPPGSVSGGSRYCLSPEQLLERRAGFEAKINSLAPGHVALMRENWGYRVVLLTSRSQIPYSRAIAGDIEVVTTAGGAQGQPNSEPRVISVLKAARVRVNPAFGSWAANLPSPYAPQVLPPGAHA